jgi:predicted aminopeptidase
MRWPWIVAVLTVVGTATAGCSTLGYYAQAAHGHLALMAAAKPVDAWLADPQAPEKLKQRLRKAQEIRAFASRELALPDNRSFTSYADLGRPAALWNSFATAELSLQLRTWCYPLFGCAGYRGYYDQAEAQRFAAALQAQGDDTVVWPVPAYSTLGWFPDPLLNTFIDWPDAELARMIFHELAHQIVYVKDDTAFNESFATLVEQEGLRRWLAASGDAQAKAQWEAAQARRVDFLALVRSTRAELEAIYAGPSDDAAKRAAKAQALTRARARYAAIKTERWGGWGGYDRVFGEGLNNAQIAAMGAYHDLVPQFAALLAAQGGDLRRFYVEVERLGGQPKAERLAALPAASGAR